MRILVVSDTHRYSENLESVICNVGKLDMVIHCGDIEGDEEHIRGMLSCPLCVVAGNNDYFANLPQEAFFEIEGRKVLVSHGHHYHVNMGIEMLLRHAITRGADIVIYGHTHRPMMENRNGIIVLNPGSISYPRQTDRRPTYMLIETDKHGDMRYTLNYIKR